MSYRFKIEREELPIIYTALCHHEKKCCDNWKPVVKKLRERILNLSPANALLLFDGIREEPRLLPEASSPPWTEIYDFYKNKDKVDE